jgi:hypothetical protein
MDLIDTLIQNIEAGKSISSSLTTLVNLIQSFPERDDALS